MCCALQRFCDCTRHSRCALGGPSLRCCARDASPPSIRYPQRARVDRLHCRVAAGDKSCTQSVSPAAIRHHYNFVGWLAANAQGTPPCCGGAHGPPGLCRVPVCRTAVLTGGPCTAFQGLPYSPEAAFAVDVIMPRAERAGHKGKLELYHATLKACVGPGTWTPNVRQQNSVAHLRIASRVHRGVAKSHASVFCDAAAAMRPPRRHARTDERCKHAAGCGQLAPSTLCPHRAPSTHSCVLSGD